MILAPIFEKFKSDKELESRGYRPLQMTFDDQLKALIFYHLEEYSSGSELLQALEQDDFAKECVASPKGIKKSAFFEAINNRGLEQLSEVFTHLVKQAGAALPAEYAHLGNLVSIDGSLIDAVLSMEWADYRSGSKKAKAHVGFDINRGIPRKIFLTDGKEGERPFVDKIIDKGETGVMDRGYQSHDHFDQWQTAEKFFVCRIRENTHKTVIRENAVAPGSIVFYDSIVLLGTKGINQTVGKLGTLPGFFRTPRFLWFEYLIQPKFQHVNEGLRSKRPSGVSGLAYGAICFFIFKGHKFPIRIVLLW